jgi:hypothetical protein
MKRIAFMFILSFSLNIMGQNSNFSPAEMSNFKDQILEQKAKEEAQKSAQKAADDKNSPPPPPQSPPANMNPAPINPVGVQMQNSQEQAAKIEKELKTLFNQNPAPARKRPGSKDEVILEKRVKSPFMIPDDLYFKIKRKMGEKSQFLAIDETVEVRLRWPLAEYSLVGVIWDTRRPRAMIKDKQGKVHVFREKELIANGGGYIAEITGGEVIVVERGAEVKMQLKSK